MNKTTSAINNIFADAKVAAKFAEVTNREVIEQHIRAEYGSKMKKLTSVSDEDYARMLQAAKEHFYRAATEYCGAHPDTNMITAMLFVMNQAEVNKVAERYVLGAAPVKGVKALFKGAKNLASKAYETAFPERNFDEDMKEFAEDLKESGQEVKEELKKAAGEAKEAVQNLKDKCKGDEDADAEEAPAEETQEDAQAEAPVTEEKPAEEPAPEEKNAESDSEEDSEEKEEDIPTCVRVIVMGIGEPTGELPEIPEEVMKGLPEEVQEILKDIMKNGGKKPATEPKDTTEDK